MVTNLKQNKIKPMTREQIIIAIDRLTRFKPTIDKYLRVFKETILNNLITPSFKKKDLEEMSFLEISNLATEIFNYSLNELNGNIENDFSINHKIKEYENSIFINSNETQALLDNKINYKSALKLLYNEDLKVKNLLWLSKVDKENNTSEMRNKYSTHFPLKKIIIAEGITEEILLPIFSKILNVDFDKYGFHIISAGGKNQVVKAFYHYAEILKLPIFVLLDNDAKENLEQIKPKVRPPDKIHLVQSGEFEDLLPQSLILRTLNNHLKNLSFVEANDFNPELSTVKNLEEIYREKGLEDFKKADFAHLISKNAKSKEDLSEEIIKIIEELKT